MKELSSEHSKTSAPTNTNQKEIQELQLAMVSVQKGLEEVKSLKTQVNAIEDKVKTISQHGNMTYIAEHANLQLSLDQHISKYEKHLSAFNEHVSSQRVKNKTFEDFLSETWVTHQQSFEDLLARLPPVAATTSSQPGSGSSVDPYTINDGDTTMPAASPNGKRRPLSL